MKRISNGRRTLANGLSHPPPIQPQIKQRMRLRYTCTTAATNKAITFFNVLDAVIIANTGAGAGVQIFDQCKIHSVEVWSAPAQGAASAQCSVQFSGAVAGFAGDGKVVSDNSMGVTPAHVRAIPEKMSQAALWQFQSANTAFLLTCPVGSVIDVDVSFRVISAAVPTATGAIAGAVVGQIYYRGLDSLAVAATTLPAQAPLTA